jgi:WD40 repeat protein
VPCFLISQGAHSSAVSALAVSVDDQYLFSAGEDGILFVFAITGLLSRLPARL